MAHIEDSSPESRRVKQISSEKIEKTIQLLLTERQQVAVATTTHDDNFLTAIKDICVQSTESLLDLSNLDDPVMGRLLTLYHDAITAIPSLITGKWHANSDSSDSYAQVIIGLSASFLASTANGRLAADTILAHLDIPSQYDFLELLKGESDVMGSIG
jgi:hypothetical protein